MWCGYLFLYYMFSTVWYNLEETIFFLQIRAKGGDKLSRGSHMKNSMDPIKLKTFVSLTMDVASASPRRYFFEARGKLPWMLHPIHNFCSCLILVSEILMSMTNNMPPLCSHNSNVLLSRSWAILQWIKLKRKNFSIFLLLKEDKTFTGTIRRRTGLFWK